MKKIVQLYQRIDMALYTWVLRRKLRKIIIKGRKTRPPLSEIWFDESDLI
jgi:hypothetical protein